MTRQINQGETLTVALPNGDRLIVDCRDADPCVAYFVDNLLIDLYQPDRSRPPIPRSIIE